MDPQTPLEPISTDPTTKPIDETPTVDSQLVNVAPQPPLSESRKPKKKPVLLVILLVLVILLAVGGTIYALKHNKKNAPTKTAQTSNSTTSPNTESTEPLLANVLLTYVNAGSSKLIVANSQDKVLASLAIPSGENAFSVLGNTGQEVLVQAYSATEGYGSSFVNPKVTPIDYLITRSGKVTKLSANISDPNVAGGYANTEGNSSLSGNYYFNISCPGTSSSSASCNVNEINLQTGTVKVVYTTFASIVSEGPNTPQIFGVSSSNVLYLSSSTSSSTLSNGDIDYDTPLIEVDPSSGQTLKTVNTPDDADCTLANDFSELACVATSTNPQPVLINVSSGQSSSVTLSSSCTSDGFTLGTWSFDNSKVAAECFNANTDTTTIGYINLTKLSFVSVLTVTDTGFRPGAGSLSQGDTEVSLEGWSANDELDYIYSTGTSSNNVATSAANKYYSVNVNTDQRSAQQPAGYELTGQQ